MATGWIRSNILILFLRRKTYYVSDMGIIGYPISDVRMTENFHPPYRISFFFYFFHCGKKCSH